MGLTHIDERGQARMVEVGHKTPTLREAVAEAYVLMGDAPWRLLRDRAVPKGDVGATARIAGVMAAKKTHELIPLCHPLRLSGIEVELSEVAGTELPAALAACYHVSQRPAGAVRVQTTVQANDLTGVEMEALTAASVAALTVYDMLKAAEKGMVIAGVRLLRKTGGKSGDWQA
jgi:cyclic pyranopterin phosphate synthase